MDAERPLSPAAVTQVALAIAALALLTLAPSGGAMLLVPLPGVTMADTVALVVAEGGTLVAAGPIARSVVVRGDVARLGGRLFANGVIPLAAPARWCGA